MLDIKKEPLEYSIEFWKQTASYFKGAPNVLFEIYNEPAHIKADDW